MRMVAIATEEKSTQQAVEAHHHREEEEVTGGAEEAEDTVAVGGAVGMKQAAEAASGVDATPFAEDEVVAIELARFWVQV